MRDHSGVFKSSLRAIGRNALAASAFWMLGLALVQIGQRLLGGWPASEIGLPLASIIGVAIALRLRARFVAYIVAGMAAFSGSELVIHLYYGIRAAQGAPTHFAVMGAGLLGVGLGTILSRRSSHPNTGDARIAQQDLNVPPESASDIAGTPKRGSSIALEPSAPFAM